MTIKPDAIIVDVDGTIALRRNRGPYEWHKVGNDAPNKPIVRLVGTLYEMGYALLIVTCRDGRFESLTTQWLYDYQIPFDRCYSKPADSDDTDVVVKARIYEDIKEEFNVQYVFDDRQEVVEMWRNNGLTCLQVADGYFK